MSSFITTYLGEHGQITLPADFIKANRLELGDTLHLIQADHQLIVIPEKIGLQVAGIRERFCFSKLVHSPMIKLLMSCEIASMLNADDPKQNELIV